MWKRDQAVRSADGQPGNSEHLNRQAATPIERAGPRPQDQRGGLDMVNIGQSVVITGELKGSEDLTVEGHVEGTIELRENVLTIGREGKITARVFAKSVIVLGAMIGNVSASDKVEIRDGGSVEGDIVSPRVVIAEGAHFLGSVDMQKKEPKPVLWQKPKATMGGVG